MAPTAHAVEQLGPHHTLTPGGALAHNAPLSCAAAESEGSASRAFCAEIQLEGDAAPEWIRLFPAGPELAAVDGRRWSLPDAAAVAALTNRRRGGIDLCIDWEHAQDRAAPEGRRADAAGWIKQVAARDGILMGRVEWAAGGRESVEGRGYRYFSPSFKHARRIRLPGQPHGGDVLAVVGGSLVNRPAFDMPALAGREDTVNEFLKKVLEALALAADAGEDKALAAIAALKAERDEAVAQAAADPPADKFVPRGLYDTVMARATTAEGKLAEQAGQALAAEAKRELDAAQAAGKFTPAQRPWFDARCAEEGGLEKVRELLGTTGEGAAAPGAGGGSAAPPKTQTSFASDEEAAIAGIFGRDAKFLDEHAPRSQGVS